MTHSENVHRIRLAGPWECYPHGNLALTKPSEKSPQRVKLPCSWQDLFGNQSGTALFIRQFNRPTGLQNQQLFLSGREIRATGEVLLNKQHLGLISANQESFKFSVSQLEVAGNRLEIRITCQPEDLLPRGLHQPIFLEIQEF